MTAHPTDADTLERLLADRHSCRAFESRAVPRETIERLLRMAQRTASWCNVQPWRIVVTSGSETERFREALLHAAVAEPARPDFPFPREYTGIHRDRRRDCGLSLYASLDIGKGDREATERQQLENFRLFGAPHVAMISCPESLGVYALADCGAYVQSFLLAAQSLGVACIAQAALATRSEAVRAHFNLPPEERVVCGISFGYADAAHPVNGYRLRRADLADVVTWRGDEAG